MKTHYLEMLSRSDFRPHLPVGNPLQVAPVSPPDPQINRTMYGEVGKQWSWTDRLPWTHEQWREYASRADIETWLAHLHGEAAGYFELDSQSGDVEIAYFGLMPAVIGQGVGRVLLSHAIEAAWRRPGSRRVWVHTCELDHPHALRNYLARGFQIYDVRETD